MVLHVVNYWAESRGANAASDETQCRSGPMIRMQQETEDKESSWEKAIPEKAQPKRCEDRTGMQNESKDDRVYLVEWVGLEHREKRRLDWGQPACRCVSQHSTSKQTLTFCLPISSLTQRIPESQNSRCLSDPCAMYTRTFDIFFGVEHNKQAKQGW